MKSNKWEVCEFSERLANAYQNVTYGKPDVFDVVETHESLLAALASAANNDGDTTVRGNGADFRNREIGWALADATEAKRQRPDLDDEQLAKLAQAATGLPDEIFYAPVAVRVRHLLK